MAEQFNPVKLKVIYQLLFEMATGKKTKTVTVQESKQQDAYDSLLSALHLIANQLQSLVLKSGIVPPYYSYQNLSQVIFVLNNQCRLQNFNREVVSLMHYNPETLTDMAFEKLIAPPSQAVWKEVQEKVIGGFCFFTVSELIFLTHDHHLLPLFCTVSRMYDDKIVLVISVTTVLEDTFQSNKMHSTAKAVKLQDEVQILHQLHTYILNHLDEPLPTLKELAILFDTEVHKLKTGFRKYYNSSVYHFYQEERLKKGHLLIQQTTLSLKEIAFLCGFGMYLNFYKAFRKKYGYSPSELSRPNQIFKQ